MKCVTGTALLSLLLATFTLSARAQLARVQAIHNAADPAAAEVDVYLGDDLLVDDFVYTQATPFIDAPADVEIVLGIAPSTSTSSADVIASFAVTLTADETYVVIATGVLDPALFAANPDGRDVSFTLLLKEGARETAEDSTKIDVFGVHGITDAPSLDIVGPADDIIVDDVGYGDMTDYVSFDEGIVPLDVTPADDNDNPLASVEVDLTGLGGTAAVVLASGFFRPEQNENGPAASALAVFPDGTVAQLGFPGEDDGCTYSKGFWKNHPEAWPMDVTPHDPFLDSGMTWSEILRTPPSGGNAFIILGRQYAAAFLNVLSGADDADIADAMERAAELLGASSPADPPRGEEREEFIELAEWLDDYNNGRIGPGHCDEEDDDDDDGPDEDDVAYLQAIHNAADPALETVDVYLGSERIVDDFAFRTATPFVPVPADTPLSVGLAPGSSESVSDVVKSFDTVLEENVSYVAIASGVLDTTAFAANPDGRDTELTVFVKPQARQRAAQQVHVPRGHYPPPGQCRLWQPGVPPGHQPSPVPCDQIGEEIGDAILVTHDGPETTPSSDVAFFAGHTVTDAPTVDVVARDVGLLVDDAAYGDLTDYLVVEAAAYTLDITPGADNETVIASFEADLSGLAGQSAAVLASGFLDPSANQQGAPFTLIAVLADGTVIELPAAAPPSGSAEGVTSLEPTGEVPSSIVLEAAYPNPFNPSTRIEFGVPESGELRLTVYDALGRLVQVLYDGQLAAGTYVMSFDADTLPSGTYFYRLETATAATTRSMVLLK